MKYQMDVGPLSRRITFKPVSAPLQNGLRFFHPPVPASLSVPLAGHLPQLAREGYGVAMFRLNTRIG